MIPCSSRPLGVTSIASVLETSRAAAVDRVCEVCVVGAVAREPVDLVHDDQVDRVALHIAEHALQRRSVRGPARPAALDELRNDQRPERMRVSPVRLTLRRDREPIAVDAARALPSGGHAQVRDGFQ
jgi:hypothetical protein